MWLPPEGVRRGEALAYWRDKHPRLVERVPGVKRGRTGRKLRTRGLARSIAIESLEILAGSLPDRALRLVREWAELHRAELEENWRRAREGQPLERIGPLP